MARELGALLAQPRLEIGGQRRIDLPAGGKAFLGAVAVDVALDVEQRVYAADRLQRQLRDDRCLALGPWRTCMLPLTGPRLAVIIT